MKQNKNFIIKVVIGLIIIGVIVFLTWYFLFQSSVVGRSDQQYINFANSYLVDIPENFLVDDFSNPSVVILYAKDTQLNTKDVKDVLLKNGIIIQPFSPLEEDNDLFEKYVKNKHTSNDNADIKTSFEEENKHKIATLEVSNKSSQELNEYIKIINLINPIMIDSSKESEAMNLMVQTASDISFQKNILEIKNRLITIGTLLKAQMSSDIYAMFDDNYKKEISEAKFQETIKNSQNMLQRQISLNGGILNKKDDEFDCKIIFADPLQVGNDFMGEIKLKKNKNKWQIVKIELPKDDLIKSEDGQSLPGGLSQDSIDKALETLKQSQ